ncbi:EVE domain-containing protein [Spiribacter sp. 2438]|uniref:EVE domain-containing protein n=1 Tax=Spiribacter sp. 2438 TaxID=2666185 RepID=UPI0012B05B7B|nr:EVE domain-containing protein [Spiribacter sp. 2438]QGM22412.1 EVE domain-containing protein [Spiribacter sp. 2438]
MAYWLMKSEPDVYGIDHLAAEPDGREPWDGIRNYQVRNMFRDQFQPGDLAFFYHSNTKVPGIVGIMEVVSGAYPDHTAFDPNSGYYDPKSDPDNPRWLMVDVQYVRHTRRLIPLSELKADPALSDMALVRRGNRLSVMPVTDAQWAHILEMEKRHVE